MQEKTIFEFIEKAKENNAHARSLVNWFNRSEGLRGAAELRTVPMAAGDLGPLADAAVVAGSSSAIISAVLTWLGQRARNRTVLIRVIRDDGARIEFEVKGRAHLDAIAETLTRFLRGETID